MKIDLEQFFVSVPGPAPDYQPASCHKLFSLRLVYLRLFQGGWRGHEKLLQVDFH